jgi:hemolysin D
MKALDWSRVHLPEADPHDFSPPLLNLQNRPPNPLGQGVLWVLLGFIALLILWAILGRLDIVAVAEGKLIPQTYLKIVQPSEGGIVKEILVKEGETVRAGQILMRMDSLITDADARSLEVDAQRKRLTLRRIDAELRDEPFQILASDPSGLAREIEAQYRAHRAALEAALAEERSRIVKGKQDLAAAEQVKSKLLETLPHYREQESAFEKLAKDGHVGPLMASDKRRERIEKEQELKTQEFLIESARANLQQSEKKLTQIETEYRRQLHNERNELRSQTDKLGQEIAKQAHRQDLLELRAPQDSIVKDLATHSIGTVVRPGTVLLTLVPKEETLRAEVWVSNDDIGFVRQGQPVKLKFAAFPFQKYGMVEGEVEHVGADAADSNTTGDSDNDQGRKGRPLVYKALVKLKDMHLEMDGEKFALSAGMQTNAEVHLGDRTVLEYLLSPVKKAWHEAGRER